jgi:transposase-like protein
MNERPTATKRQRFLELSEAGRSVKDAAVEIGVAASTGYMWLRQAKFTKAITSEPGRIRFAQLVPTNTQEDMVLEVAGVVVKIPSNFDEHTLLRLVGALRRSA